jgi:predicted permease
MMERAAAIPGVEEAAITTDVPATTDMSRVGFQVEGRSDPGNLEEWPKGHHRRVSWNYTHVMGVPIVRGRGFTPQDNATAPLVVMVNRTAAETYWPGVDPIGKRIALPFSKEWRTIVGITGDIRHQGLARGSAPEIYFPFSQWTQPRISVTLIVKTTGDPLRFAEPLRREIAAIDPDLPVSGISTIENHVEKMAAQPRFSSRLFEILAGIALLLAVTGLYSVLAYLVSRRTAEFGLRMALGASPGRLLRGVLGDGLRWAVAGALVGSVAAALMGRVIQPLLFGVAASDSWVYAVAVAALLPAAALACLAPALRASRVDPAVALRAE